MDCHKGIIEGLLKLYSRVILRVSVKASSFLFIRRIVKLSVALSLTIRLIKRLANLLWNGFFN